MWWQPNIDALFTFTWFKWFSLVWSAVFFFKSAPYNNVQIDRLNNQQVVVWPSSTTKAENTIFNQIWVFLVVWTVGHSNWFAGHTNLPSNVQFDWLAPPASPSKDNTYKTRSHWHIFYLRWLSLVCQQRSGLIQLPYNYNDRLITNNSEWIILYPIIKSKYNKKYKKHFNTSMQNIKFETNMKSFRVSFLTTTLFSLGQVNTNRRSISKKIKRLFKNIYLPKGKTAKSCCEGQYGLKRTVTMNKRQWKYNQREKEGERRRKHKRKTNMYLWHTFE